jgi:hypothetical protein
MPVSSSFGEAQKCIRYFTKTIEGLWFDAFLTLFFMSIQTPQSLSMRCSTVLKTRRNGEVDYCRTCQVTWAHAS